MRSSTGGMVTKAFVGVGVEVCVVVVDGRKGSVVGGGGRARKEVVRR